MRRSFHVLGACLHPWSDRAQAQRGHRGARGRDRPAPPRARVAFPFGEAYDYDLTVDRAGTLERVQVKYAESDGEILVVRCRTQSLTNGRVRSTKRYTAAHVEWIAVYDGTTGRCHYVPAAELGDGHATLTLRITAARNNQARGVRLAADYLEF